VMEPPVYSTRLDQNRPNPFNPRTSLRFALESPDHVTLAIYDVLGRRVRTLIDDVLGAGPHVDFWDGLDERGVQVASGVYLYKLTTGSGFGQSRKMVLLR
ncbi:MAG: FlgD immunoglobulin-like domain containing protein, partial [Candidatus Krumholzibacteriia bacterium]